MLKKKVNTPHLEAYLQTVRNPFPSVMGKWIPWAVGVAVGILAMSALDSFKSLEVAGLVLGAVTGFGLWTFRNQQVQKLAPADSALLEVWDKVVDLVHVVKTNQPLLDYVPKPILEALEQVATTFRSIDTELSAKLIDDPESVADIKRKVDSLMLVTVASVHSYVRSHEKAKKVVREWEQDSQAMIGIVGRIARYHSELGEWNNTIQGLSKSSGSSLRSQIIKDLQAREAAERELDEAIGKVSDELA